ncbi:MAG: hypothetical protein HKN18_01245 [Silicimonas sp.]|nr:hypothetical protein [Silicimonas sp.]
MIQFVKQHKWLSFAFALAFVITLVFLIRLTASVVYWSDPRHVDQTIAGWMTPRYVSRSWSVPPEVIAEALDLERSGVMGRTTLDRIAAQKNLSFEALVKDLNSAIGTFRGSLDE